MKIAALLLVCVLTLCTGCVQARPVAQPRTTEFLCWAPDLAFAAPFWQEEASQRFPGAVVLVTHGGQFYSPGNPNRTKWKITADPDDLAKFLKQAFPGRPIVITACNERGDELHVAGVWYARDTVWSPPDAWRPFGRDNNTEPGVGSINEFVEGKP